MYRARSPLVRLVGRAFFRIVRRFPFVFGLASIGGLVLGYCSIFVLHDANPARAWFLRVIGVGCLIFYGWLLVLLIRKLGNKSWPAFCDWALDIFRETET